MMTLDRRNLIIGMMLAGFGTFLFALKSIIIKLAYVEGIDPVTLLTLRMFVAFPIYAAVFWYAFRRKPEQRNELGYSTVLPIMVMAFLGYYLASLLDLMGLELITAQLERLTLFTYPTLVTILGWLFFKEKITSQIIVALVLTYAGVMVLYLHEANVSGTNVQRGVLLVFASSLSFSFYLLFAKRYISRLGSLLFTSLAMMASSVYVTIHFLLLHPVSGLLVSGKLMILVFLLSIFSTVIPSFMISEAVGRIGAAKTSIIGVIGPVVTIALAVMILGEPFTINYFWGTLLVLGGVMFLSLEKSGR